MLHVTNLSLTFEDAARTRFKVLDIPRLDARPGALLVLTGSSGSGKTTLLNTLCGMQAADEGRIDWAGQEISSLSETARDRWRRDHVGLVFQDFHLIEELSPLDNVLVPAWFSRFRAGKLRQRAKGLLSDHGGACQSCRVANGNASPLPVRCCSIRRSCWRMSPRPRLIAPPVLPSSKRCAVWRRTRGVSSWPSAMTPR